MVKSTFVPTEALLFFNRADAATIDAFAAQIIPSEEGSPGAREAGVVYYIDRALAGFMRDLQPLYRRGLEAISDLAVSVFGKEFSMLYDFEQRSLVAGLDARSQSQPEDFAGQFYRVVREHTVQGFFGDPAYGGNRDVVGWKLVGFPGAQWGYSREQMQPGVDARSIPILTIGDLYSRIGANRT
ncbi:gluconate 2-dehydrogenase subunit 3 family protein [Naasia lichenicola]|uniref:Gluconate 2-dehydrogenase subunit 3 family protein n=1 Tax=Naasia lichenicola TaxID=2565933 RepID=A0A4S4FTC6_9MICO|nr:gluconate 2-dehydrogenase subunit 3 family protein [Naasia lichenicola]THG32816.1 gluconate 2-dehydrogenase subunit 3 family protein [Naasia lichenicola]